MAADVKLLPLPDWAECMGEITQEDIRDYARANVEAATEALRKRCEAVEADAARYRWIRTMAHEVIDWDYMPPLPEGFNPLYSGCSDSLEASIDAAIAAAQEHSHG